MSERQPVIAGVVLALGVLMIPVYVWIFAIRSHRVGKLYGIEQQLLDVDRDLEQARAAQRRYAQFRAEVQQLDEERAKLSRFVPPVPDDDVSALLGTRPHVLIRERSPRTDQPWVERQFDVELTGSLPTLNAYFSGLERPPRLIAARRIELTHDGELWRAKAIVGIAYDR